MEELSAAIGVSRPTLSKYFQDPDSVRISTRRRIQQGLESFDYIPNFFATKMNRGATRLIGIIIPHINDLHYTSLTEAIERRALERGYLPIIQNSDGSRELEARAARNLVSMSADGVIVAPLGVDGNSECVELLQTKLPLVLVDSYLPGHFETVDFVGTDNFQSIALIVDYLCETGDPPVFLGMPPLNSNSVERERAYRDRMSQLGHESHVIDCGGMSPGWGFEEYAYRLVQRLFSSGKYTASTILCANDRLAMGVLRAAHQHRLIDADSGERNRGLFRVAGHDDHPLSAYFTPSLTTVSQNVTAIGEAAVEQLLARMELNQVEARRETVIRFPAQLKIRESA